MWLAGADACLENRRSSKGGRGSSPPFSANLMPRLSDSLWPSKPVESGSIPLRGAEVLIGVWWKVTPYRFVGSSPTTPA